MAGWACGGGALALGSLPALAQTNPDLEDFEDIRVIGEERPTTIGDIDGPTVIGAIDEEGNIILEDVADSRDSVPVRGDIGTAMRTLEDGDGPAALKMAKRLGTADGNMLAGMILLDGKAGYLDDEEAVQWLQLAADEGNVDALMWLGKLAVDGRGGLSPRQAGLYYKRAAELGSTEAMRAMSTLAQEGIGFQANDREAAEWERKAAVQGDAEAVYRQAVRVRDTDPLMAFTLFEDAAARGHADAAYEAAILQVTNYDLPPNEAKAAKLMRQAAEAGVPEALADYGLMVYQGAGVPRDDAAAARFFRLASEAGDKEGMFLYAFSLAKGEGVAQNYEEAYYWLLKSGGDSGVDEYDASRRQLREKLEQNVDRATLERARTRADAG